MNRNNIPCRSIAILLFTVLLSSCLKETAVPIEPAFTVEASEDKTAPVTIQLKNESYGADEYEWIFEGGIPESSSEKSPGQVVFNQTGEHKIILRVRNAVEEKTSCQTIRVDSAMTIDFDFSLAINDIAPGTISIINKSKGGNSYEWTFEGGEPATSHEQHPKSVVFSDGGKHKIHLKVFNGSRYEELTKILTLQPPIQADFSYEPLPVDRDWEAPLTLRTTNLTTNGLSYHWICKNANVHSPNETNTDIRFEQPGTYKLQLIANNGKEEKTVEKAVAIKPSSGIILEENLKFGINEAKNSIGCFYSAKERGVLTSNQISQNDDLGHWVDFGFFALNSSFNYCYFFAPNQAKANSFPKIDNAQDATFINNPVSMGINITNAIFDNIKRSSDLNQFTKWSETNHTTAIISNRIKEDIATGGNGKIIGQAHISTEGNNELGKMVEFKAMENARFKGGRNVPSNYMNAWRSGESAWNDKNNAHLREKASKLADELIRKHDSDVANRKKTSYKK